MKPVELLSVLIFLTFYLSSKTDALMTKALFFNVQRNLEEGLYRWKETVFLLKSWILSLVSCFILRVSPWIKRITINNIPSCPLMNSTWGFKLILKPNSLTDSLIHIRASVWSFGFFAASAARATWNDSDKDYISILTMSFCRRITPKPTSSLSVIACHLSVIYPSFIHHYLSSNIICHVSVI